MDDPQEAVYELLGWPGRMISFSKSGYRERRPDHAAVFNANVCLLDGKVWFGDLDLTVDEPRILALAERLGQVVFVLYEGDGHFRHEEQPLLKQAPYRAFPGGQAAFDQRVFHRDEQRMLRRLPPPPPAPPHTVTPWDWEGSRRWRLLRFWKLQRIQNGDDYPLQRINRLLYVGERGRRSPLLVLGLFHTLAPKRAISVELTWYPSSRPYRSTAYPDVKRRIGLGPIEIHASITRWPGYLYQAWLHIEYGSARR